eukprot:6846629-Pyramimonas_sp.AAC.1
MEYPRCRFVLPIQRPKGDTSRRNWASLLCTSSSARPVATRPRPPVPVPSPRSALWPALE